VYFICRYFEFHEDHSARPQPQISEGSGNARYFGPYKNYHGFCERLRVVVVKNIDTMAVIFKRYFDDALNEMCNVRGKGLEYEKNQPMLCTNSGYEKIETS
jgi:hypothetical protein